jgi:hypothetical protein
MKKSGISRKTWCFELLLADVSFTSHLSAPMNKGFQKNSCWVLVDVAKNYSYEKYAVNAIYLYSAIRTLLPIATLVRDVHLLLWEVVLHPSRQLIFHNCRQWIAMEHIPVPVFPHPQAYRPLGSR